MLKLTIILLLQLKSSLPKCSNIHPQIAVCFNQVQVASAWFLWLEVLPTQPVPAVHGRMWMTVMTHQTAAFWKDADSVLPATPLHYIREKYWSDLECLCGCKTFRAELSSTATSWNSTVVSYSMCWVWGGGMWVWCVWGGRRSGIWIGPTGM